MAEIEPTAVAWAAGLFEGEGCIYIGKPYARKSNRKITASLSMSDEDVVNRFCSIVGKGSVIRVPKGQYKPAFCWVAGKRRDVESILNKFLPYLGERRKAKAREALIFSQTHPLTYRKMVSG